MSIDFGYEVLCIASMTVLVVLALVCLVRCIMGPRISDRVMAVNMIGTLTIIMVVVFVVHLGEAYLADIALIYAMISFLSVVVLCKVYTGIYRERKHEQELLGAVCQLIDWAGIGFKLVGRASNGLDALQ